MPAGSEFFLFKFKDKYGKELRCPDTQGRYHTSNIYYNYGKCPKISYTKVSDKMAYANSADPDQGAV